PRGRERYQAVHAQAPAALARACAEHGLRLLHVSALGLEAPARSGFIRSKREGEAGIRAAGGQACLVRPSLLDADDSGFGARWLRRVARWPVHPLPASARGHIAALDVRDLREAIARLLLQPEPLPAAVELGGRDALDLGDYLALLRRSYRGRAARRVSVPGWLAGLVAHACDLRYLTPLSYGHWELLGRDNLPAENALPALLGRLPRRLGPAEADPRPMPQSVAPWAIPRRVRRSLAPSRMPWRRRASRKALPAARRIALQSRSPAIARSCASRSWAASTARSRCPSSCRARAAIIASQRLPSLYGRLPSGRHSGRWMVMSRLTTRSWKRQPDGVATSS